ncbi:hypothetical protein D3C71_1407030 [compost metagenome]
MFTIGFDQLHHQLTPFNQFTVDRFTACFGIGITGMTASMWVRTHIRRAPKARNTVYGCS